jgi:hypothetical protein
MADRRRLMRATAVVVLATDRGTVRMSELWIAMQGCAATGDDLVLKNLVPDLKLAPAN